jgi:heme ABC exporter ATP-binding subunit CcmA
MAIELEGISRRFARRWALRNVRMTIAPGEVIGVMGHNGSGKSTLLRVVSTAIRPSAGTGRVFGHDLVRDADRVRSLTGFLAHTPGLYDDLTAAENLRFAATMLGVDDAPIDAVLARVGLSRERDTRVRGFSAGMQRRLSLARILLQRPRLLLLDEPYNSFDADGIALVNEVIRETRDGGGAALVVVHDLVHASQVLDRVIEMRDGAVIAQGREAERLEGRAALAAVGRGG